MEILPCKTDGRNIPNSKKGSYSMKKLTTAALLVTALSSHSVQAFAKSNGMSGDAFSRYLVATPDSVALSHYDSKGSINGIVTIDVDGYSGAARTSTIKVYSDGMDTAAKTALLKFALLKSVNLGCKASKVTGSISDIDKSEFSSFGDVSFSKDSISFDSLPTVSLDTLSSYAFGGISSGITALSTIALGTLSQVSQSILSGSAFRASPFNPAFAFSGYSSSRK